MSEPVPMLLTCPSCGARHIDEGEFATKPHHAHACQSDALHLLGVNRSEFDRMRATARELADLKAKVATHDRIAAAGPTTQGYELWRAERDAAEVAVWDAARSLTSPRAEVEQ